VNGLVSAKTAGSRGKDLRSLPPPPPTGAPVVVVDLALDVVVDFALDVLASSEVEEVGTTPVPETLDEVEVKEPGGSSEFNVNRDVKANTSTPEKTLVTTGTAIVPPNLRTRLDKGGSTNRTVEPLSRLIT
jgi:hypothetical protein